MLRVPGVGVVVAEPVTARTVLSKTAAFAKHGPGSSGALWTPVLGDRVLLNMDGPEHLALRRSLSDLFSTRAVADVCRQAAVPLVEDAVAGLRRGDECDVVVLARRVSAAVIGAVVGLEPGSNPDRLVAANDAIESMVSWRTRELDAAQVDRARSVLQVVQDATDAAHRAARGDTVMGRLALQGVSLADARSLAAALFLTGTGTVSSAQPRIVGQLADAGLLAPGAPSFATVDSLVTEGLRMTTPSPATLRRCVATTEVGGVTVRPDERVVVLLWWATRLEGGFDPTRTVPADLRHLWFGAGSHFCLGAPLALAELRLMTLALLDVAAERGLVVTRRRAARRVLVPRYAELVVRAGAGRAEGVAA
ncbi:MAG: hypothetical protein JWP82_556 [Humibacillus sp.]|nr:hypothetical protein [Humibacillus sp.]